MRADFKIKNEAGFTLTELMITVAIFAIVLTAVFSSFTSQFKSYQTQEDVALVQGDIRSAAEMLTRDIRNAGFGVPTGGGITTVAAANGTSITLNLAGTTSSTFISTTSTIVVAGSSYTIPVMSTTGFVVGQKYNIIENRTKTIEMGATNLLTDKITAIGTNTLTFSGTLTAGDVFNVGDVVVSPGFTPVTYSLATPIFSRTDPVSGSTVTLSNNVQSFTLSYILTDGTTTSTPANLSMIAAVNFTINGQTSNQISNLNGQKRSRTVNAIVALRN